jgi:hypothetical protein
VVSVVLLVVAAVVIGVGMIVVAGGRGGEMTEYSPDVRPLDTDIATAADVALLRPSVALWGYDKRSTDQALNLVARAMTERDIEIATLRRQIADLQSGQDAPSARPADPAAHLDAIWGPHALPGADDAARADDAGEPGVAAPLGQPGAVSPFVRREASPAPPPAETQPWSAWEASDPPQRPGPGEPADPEQAG